MFTTYHAMGRFSRQQNDDIFRIILGKHKSFFSRKNKKVVSKCRLLLFLPSMLSVSYINPCPAEPGYTRPLQTV